MSGSLARANRVKSGPRTICTVNPLHHAFNSTSSATPIVGRTRISCAKRCGRAMASAFCRSRRPATMGCALLAQGAEVVAADLSIPQLSCLELRCAAFRQLDHEQVLAFLGIRAADNRLATFDRLRGGLSPAARDFWAQHHADIAHGIIHAGKFEAYFGLFRRWFLPLIHSQRTIHALLEPKDRAARQAFWKTWDNRRWRFLFRLFFSRRLMGSIGHDPEFFRYVEGSVSQRFMDRAWHGLVELPTDSNPFLDYIVHGNFTRTVPRYLRPEQFDKVRSGLDRLTLHHGSIEQAGQQHRGDGFDAFNLSDIFEYLIRTRPATCMPIWLPWPGRERGWRIGIRL